MKKALAVLLLSLLAPAAVWAGDFGVGVRVNDTTTIVAPGRTATFAIPNGSLITAGLQVMDEGVAYGDIGGLVATAKGVACGRGGDQPYASCDKEGSSIIIAYSVGADPWRWWYLTATVVEEKEFRIHVLNNDEVRKRLEKGGD